MVLEQSKHPALRINGGFIVDGTVLEMVDQLRADAISMRDLDEVARRQRLAIRVSQHKKAVNRPFYIVHGNRLRPQRSAEKKYRWQVPDCLSENARKFSTRHMFVPESHIQTLANRKN